MWFTNLSSVTKSLDIHGLLMPTVKVYAIFPWTPWKDDGKFLGCKIIEKIEKKSDSVLCYVNESKGWTTTQVVGFGF